MLMDEPFGAIDPINRERLQNEFLRLQAELRKTIVFVTHDIDEAIKMGDRIAILQEGGILAQYATPGRAADVPGRRRSCADFVGSDRALKRLALQRVRDIDLWKAPLVRIGEPVSDVRAQARRRRPRDPARSSTTTAARLGWLSERGLQGERVREDFRSPAEPVVELDDILRDALVGPAVGRLAVRPGRRRRRARRRRALDRGALARADASRPMPSAAELRHRARHAEDGLSERHDARPHRSPSSPSSSDDFFGNREGAAEKCPGNNGLCPGWIVDNFSDYIASVLAARRC